jgi:hypothetical protein
MSQFNHLPLQDMIRNVVTHATEKLAADQDSEAQLRAAVEGKTAPAAKAQSAEAAEATDPGFVEKLASVCDFIAENVNHIETPNRGVLGQAIAKMAGEEVAPAVTTPDQLSVQAAMGGKQKYKHDKPKGHDAAVSTAGSPENTHGLPGGATLMENDMNSAPGGNNSSVPTKAYPAAGVLHAGTKTAAAVARARILSKLAGEDVMKANVSGGKGGGPLVGDGELQVMDVTQHTSNPTDGSGYGNQQRGAIASNEAATNYTKGDAKKPRAKELKEVLKTPAFDPGADSKLREQLRNSGSAGVKIAAANNKELLKQAAAQGLLTQETVNQYKLTKQAMDTTGEVAGGDSKVDKLKALMASASMSTGGM